MDGKKKKKLSPAESFRLATSKLDNWLNHKRIEEYFEE